VGILNRKLKNLPEKAQSGRTSKHVILQWMKEELDDIEKIQKIFNNGKDSFYSTPKKSLYERQRPQIEQLVGIYTN
jgi:hypothetical protein